MTRAYCVAIIYIYTTNIKDVDMIKYWQHETQVNEREPYEIIGAWLIGLSVTACAIGVFLSIFTIV